MLIDDVKTYLVVNSTWASAGMKCGYANGYVSVPPRHPWYEKYYDQIHNEYPELSVHGGLTYSFNAKPNHPADGLWWVGFDTLHSGDNAVNCSREYCEAEVNRLRDEAVALLPEETSDPVDPEQRNIQPDL